jgi:hypothetical protein
MRRSLVWVIGVSLLAAAFSLAQEPIKIGCLLELTGACAAYGQMAREALEFAREAGIVPTEVLVAGPFSLCTSTPALILWRPPTVPPV